MLFCFQLHCQPTAMSSKFDQMIFPLLQAGFLARLAGSDVATASARSSLKSLKFDSPGMQLALKHCFILDDPPDWKKDPAGSQRFVYWLDILFCCISPGVFLMCLRNVQCCHRGRFGPPER